MVHELKKGIEEGKIFFGIKQSLRNSNNLDKAKVSSDCRLEIIDALRKKNIEIEQMNFSKEELSNRLELNFQCEVFGIKK